MADASRDENRITIGQGKTSTDVLEPLLIDPVTGRLMIHVTFASEGTSILPGAISKRDENRETASSGLAGSSPQDLLFDNRSSLPFIDLVVE